MPQNVASVTANLDLNVSQAERSFQSFARRIENSKGLSLGKINGQLNEFDKSLKASNARVLAFGASAGIFIGIQKGISGIVKASIDVEKKLTDINVVLGATQTKLKQFGGDLFKVAKDTGQSFDKIAESAIELSRQGLKAEEILKRTRDAAILSRQSNLDLVESTSAITAALNSFNKAGLDSTVLINKLAAVDAKFAVNSGDLAEAIKRVGSTAQDAGVSIDELIGLVTTAQQITGRGGAVIGNSLKTILSKIQLKEVQQQLYEFGVQIRDNNGALLPTVELLKNLSKSYETLGSAQKAQIAKTVGGLYQINQLRALLGDLTSANSIYTASLKTSEGATSQAVDRNKELNQTLAALVSQTGNTLKQAGASIGQSAVNPLLKLILNTTNSVFALGEESGGELGKGLLKGIGGILTGPGLLTSSLLLGTLIKNFVGDLKMAGKSVLGLNDLFKNQIVIQKQISNSLSKQPSIIGKATGESQKRLIVEREILAVLQSQGQLMTLKNSPAYARPNTAQNLTSNFIRNNVGANVFSQNVPSAILAATLPQRGKRGKFQKSELSRMAEWQKQVAASGGYSGDVPLDYIGGQYVPAGRGSRFQEANSGNLTSFRNAAALNLIGKRQITTDEILASQSLLHGRGQAMAFAASQRTTGKGWTPEKYLAEQEEAKYQKDLQKRKNQKRMIGASFLLPIAAGIGQEFIGDDTRGQRAGSASLGAAGNIASLAGLGSLAGAPGAIIGGVVGLAGSYSDLIKGFTSELPDFNKHLEESRDKTLRLGEAFNQFIVAAEQLKQPINDLATFSRIKGQQGEALNFIRQNSTPEEFKAIFNTIKGSQNPDETTRQLFAIRNREDTANEIAMAAREFRENPNKFLNKSVTDVLAGQEGGASIIYGDSKLNKEGLEQFNKIRNGLVNTKDAKGDNLIDFLYKNKDILKGLQDNKDNELGFNRFLSRSFTQRGFSDEQKNKFLSFTQGPDAKLFRGELSKEFSNETLQAREEELATLNGNNEIAKKTAKVAEKHIKNLENLNEGLLKWSLGLDQAFRVQSNQRSIGLKLEQTRAQGDLNRIAPFLRPEELLNATIGNQRKSAQSESNVRIQDLNQVLRTKTSSIITDEISQLNKKSFNNFGAGGETKDRLSSEARTRNFSNTLGRLSAKENPQEVLNFLSKTREGLKKQQASDEAGVAKFSGIKPQEFKHRLEAIEDIYKKVSKAISENNTQLKINEDNLKGVFDEIDLEKAEKFLELQRRTDFSFSKDLLSAGRISGRGYGNLISTQADEKIATNGKLTAGEIGTTFASQFKYNTQDYYQDLKDGAVDVAQTMKSGFSDAFKEFVFGAKNAQDALRGLGLAIANKLLDKSIDISLNSLIGGVSNVAGAYFGKANGGLIKGYSVGGKVNGGSGTKDDVPAMLSAGEYVVKKSAVNKYGESFLHKLNSGGVVGFANGGSAMIKFANEFNRNDSKRPTGGKYNISSKLSNFALSNEDDLVNLRKLQNVEDVTKYLDDKAAYDQQVADAIAAYKRGQRQRIIGAYINAAIGIAGAGLGAAAKGMQGAGNARIGSSQTSPIVSPGMTLKPAPSSFTPSSFYSGLKYANGGPIFGGNSSSDSVPAMLTAGEFIINKQTVQKHGVNFMDKLNRGQYAGFANGGYVGNVESQSKSVNDTMVELVDALTVLKQSLDSKENEKKSGRGQENNTAAMTINNSITISMNGGDVKGDSKSNSQNRDKEGTKRNDMEQGQKLAELMKNTCIKVLVEQKRQGGLLENVR